MKKNFALFSLLVLILFTSCTKQIFAVSPERKTNFTADVKISFSEKSFSGKLDCSSPCSMKLTFEEPSEINGFSVMYNGNDYICDVLGKEDVINAQVLSDGSFIKLFFDGLNCALYDEAKLSPNANDDFNSQFQGGKFKAIYASNGMIKLLYSDAFSLSANFF